MVIGTIDPTRLEASDGHAFVKHGATLNAALVVLGDEPVRYRAMATSGPGTATETPFNLVSEARR